MADSKNKISRSTPPAIPDDAKENKAAKDSEAKPQRRTVEHVRQAAERRKNLPN